MNLFNRYDFIIFDLDMTLYDEVQYLKTAYSIIANRMSSIYNLEAVDLNRFLISEFENEGRRGLFNKLCREFDIPESAIPEMLALMRSIRINKIQLYQVMRELIERLIAEGKKLYIITNGNPEQQQNKINSIDWQGLDSHIEIILANTISPKPDLASFDYLVQKFGLIAAKTVFIGDSQTDQDFAKNAGIDFIHVDNILNN